MDILPGFINTPPVICGKWGTRKSN